MHTYTHARKCTKPHRENSAEGHFHLKYSQVKHACTRAKTHLDIALQSLMDETEFQSIHSRTHTKTHLYVGAESLFHSLDNGVMSLLAELVQVSALDNDVTGLVICNKDVLEHEQIVSSPSKSIPFSYLSALHDNTTLQGTFCATDNE